MCLTAPTHAPSLPPSPLPPPASHNTSPPHNATTDLRGRFDVLSPAPPRSWLLDLHASADRPVVELPQMGQDAGPVDFSLVRLWGGGKGGGLGVTGGSNNRWIV